jgi:hypothetical protein
MMSFIDFPPTIWITFTCCLDASPMRKDARRSGTHQFDPAEFYLRALRIQSGVAPVKS